MIRAVKRPRPHPNEKRRKRVVERGGRLRVFVGVLRVVLDDLPRIFLSVALQRLDVAVGGPPYDPELLSFQYKSNERPLKLQ